LQEGVDVYFLAEQMGTSVHMIESHYGHVNTIKHADRVLQGMSGWELTRCNRTMPSPWRGKQQRPTINAREVNATNRVDGVSPRSRFLPEPLAEAGAVRHSSLISGPDPAH
jgi:hypothetical protein